MPFGSEPFFSTTYDLSTLLSNPGFESGLIGWNYDPANTDNYLTATEWDTGTWNNSSPFYTDAELATYYPGNPWGLNPSITHVQQSTGTSGPTTPIDAAVGSSFVGSRQDGYAGHCQTGGSACGPQEADYDTNFRLNSDSFNNMGSGFSAGDVLTLTVWAVRGRLNADWEEDNNSSELRAFLLGGNIVAGGQPTGVSNTARRDFTFGTDGIWASETFTWTLADSATDLTLRLTGLNSNHDRYVAVDLGPVPVPAAVWLFGSGLLSLVGIARRRKTG